MIKSVNWAPNRRPIDIDLQRVPSFLLQLSSVTEREGGSMSLNWQTNSSVQHF